MEFEANDDQISNEESPSVTFYSIKQLLHEEELQLAEKDISDLTHILRCSLIDPTFIQLRETKASPNILRTEEHILLYSISKVLKGKPIPKSELVPLFSQY